MITTCTDCGALYEAGSEEQANEPERWCLACRVGRRIVQKPEILDRLKERLESDDLVD